MKILRVTLLICALILFTVPSYATDAVKGRLVYEKYCQWCHGRDGAGDGPSAPYLNPPPRDFTYGLYKWKSTPFEEITPSDEDFRKMITGRYGKGVGHGLNGTAMPGWGKVLTKNEIKYLIAYIKDFSGLEQPEEKAIDTSLVSKVSGNGLLARGRSLFKDNCVSCHGAKGRGDGEKRLKDDFGARTWPRNLTKPWTFRAGATAEDIYTRITTGIQGTQMPSFADPDSRKVLSDEERAVLARYVTTLAAPYKKPGAGRLIKALRVSGPLPATPSDVAWESVEYSSFALFPQLVSKERLFTPTIDSISVKALYNDKEAVILLEWDDRTESRPGVREAKKLATGKLFRDGAAIQIPLKRPPEGQRPPLAMGDEITPVSIWRWQSSTADTTQSFSVLRATGSGLMRRDKGSGISAHAIYRDGTWSLILRGPLGLAGDGVKGEGHIMSGSITPLAIALWDGSDGEVGSKHVLSAWLGLDLREKHKTSLFWPLLVLVLVALGEVYLVRAVGKEEEQGE